MGLLSFYSKSLTSVTDAFYFIGLLYMILFSAKECFIMNRDPQGKDNIPDFGFSDSDGWLGGTGYQENNEFGNNNFDDINTYNGNQYRPSAPPPQSYPQNTYGEPHRYGSELPPYRDGYRDPFSSGISGAPRNTFEAAGPTPPPLILPSKRLSAGFIVLFFAWLVITTGTTAFTMFSGEIWTTFPYSLQLFAGLTVFFIAPPARRSFAFGTFIFIDALFIAGIIVVRLLNPMFTLALTRHSAIHILEALAFITGFSLTVGRLITGAKRKKNCTVPVEGKCLRVITDYVPYTKGKTVSLFRPVYQYEYRGRHYESFDNDNPKLKAPRTGEAQTLLLDPESPADICVRNKTTTGGVILIITGILLMIGSAAFFAVEMAETLELMIH